ncbi:BMP family lipoprotein [Mycoplasma procyoni]|uniref:BMP family lipoprotein n=1 Tax=Mycoplasma procyoni TaxID=568784 RepID=UPI00197B45E7|nr:BMP family ABC transporter substrate-binding protein [Mycoplasma procyoni]MBN3534612.1 BMP family ABC transporter substrate-binding protein [Mycoplasma procyoni]
MKKKLISFITPAIALSSFAIVSCNNSSKDKENTDDSRTFKWKRSDNEVWNDRNKLLESAVTFVRENLLLITRGENGRYRYLSENEKEQALTKILNSNLNQNYDIIYLHSLDEILPTIKTDLEKGSIKISLDITVSASWLNLEAFRSALSHFYSVEKEGQKWLFKNFIIEDRKVFPVHESNFENSKPTTPSNNEEPNNKGGDKNNEKESPYSKYFKIDDEKINDYYAKTDYAEISDLVAKKTDEVAEAINSNKTKDLKIALITVNSKVSDKAFNQSLWEAISKQSFQTNNKTSRYVEVEESEISDLYDQLLETDMNVWVLSGYQHSYAFKWWYKNSSKKARFDAKHPIIIAVHWDEDDSELPKGQFISLNYRQEEAGWIAGYAAANYLAQTEEDDSKRKTVAFGGHPAAVVTNFIAGYLGGIYKYNEEHEKVTKLTDDRIILYTGFDPDNPDSREKVDYLVKNSEPKIILPISGKLIDVVIEGVKKANKEQLIIGVDTDQSKAFESDAELFFTSIEKRLGATLYRVLTDLFIQKGTNSNIIPEFKEGAEGQNAHVYLGYYDGFTDVSKSSLSDDKKTIAQASLDKAIAKFKELLPETNKYNREKMESDLAIPFMTVSGEANVPGEKTNQVLLDELAQKINKQTGKIKTQTN